MARQKGTVFPKVFTAILENCDTERRWHWHIVKESPTGDPLPFSRVDDETITVFLPREMATMPRAHARYTMRWLVDRASGADTIPTIGMVRYFNTAKYRDARREVVLEELGISGRRKVPEAFNEAMAIHPGLRECLDGMAFTYCEPDGDGIISRSDYPSRTIIMVNIFDDPDRLLLAYVAFRELAGICSTRCTGEYAMRPDPRLMAKYLKRFVNWQVYETRCAERGWKFRYPLEVI